MSNADKRRGRIAAEAARRFARGGDLRRARFGAARRVSRDWVPEAELPTAVEISSELSRQRLTAEHDASGGLKSLIGDRFDRLAGLLRPLAAVRLDPAVHPVDTLLESCLSAFAYVEQQCPYDEELLTAALLADAGEVLDRRDPVQAILRAAEPLITERTGWFIENRNVAAAYESGELGHRARQRLVAHPDFDGVLLLVEAARAVSRGDAPSPTLIQVIKTLRTLSDAE